MTLFGEHLPLRGVCDGPAKRFYWANRVAAYMSGILPPHDWKAAWNAYLQKRYRIARPDTET